jgi:hypothetical protein
MRSSLMSTIKEKDRRSHKKRILAKTMGRIVRGQKELRKLLLCNWAKLPEVSHWA